MNIGPALCRDVDANLFANLVKKSPDVSASVERLRNMGLTQKDILIKTISENIDSQNPQISAGIKGMLDKLMAELDGKQHIEI